jgi:hypothetical protein
MTVLTTRKQRELMEHAIGLAACKGTRGKVKPGWRNYFCASPGGTDALDWIALVRAGLAIEGRTDTAGDSVYFHVTDAGFIDLGLKPPKAQRK